MLYRLLGLLPFVSRVLCKTSAELCHGTSTVADDGNWYCSEVLAITYKDISQPGEYNRTTDIDPQTGLCQHEPISYAGVSQLTPLIGELSMHLRGPMNVSQLAVYKLPGASMSKRSSTGRRRSERRMGVSPNQDDKETPYVNSDIPPMLEKRWFCQSTPTITVTVHSPDSICRASPTSSIAQLPPPASPAPAPVLPAPVIPPPPAVIPPPPPAQPAVTTTVHDTTTVCPKSATPGTTNPVGALPVNSTSYSSACLCRSSSEANSSNTPLPLPLTSSCPSGDSTNTPATHILHSKREEKAQKSLSYTPTNTRFAGLASPSGGVKRAAPATWDRVAYYTSAAPAAATGFTFLANLGDPDKSGTFDYSFGNSLGYVIGDGSKVASQDTPFSGTLETSEREIAVFTDKVCDEQDCEYWRPGATAYHGWDGSSKAFFIEFQMDHYDNYGNDQGMLSDAPAWWFLNAAIPRILQYGNDRRNVPCSCWSTGCGEFDAFEVLGRGEMRAKSTIHRQGNLEGGDSNYFLRPVGRTLKFVVIFHNWNITARVLDDGFDFSEGVTAQQIEDILDYDPNDSFHSLFPIGD